MENTTDTIDSGQYNPTDDDPEIVFHANYELFIIALLLLQLFNSVLWLLVSDPEQNVVLEIVGEGIGAFLLLDALYRVYKVPNRRRYLGKFHGWLTILGSLPVPFICLLRMLWYVLMIRKLRKDDYGLIRRVVVEQRARSTLLAVFLMAILVVEISSLLIIKTEAIARDANIHTASDAIWWSLVTIATVGYGDKYPVTNQGRIVGVGLMIVGVSLFGVFTSFLAQWFVMPKKRLPFQANEPTEDKEMNELRVGLDEIKRLLDIQAITHQESASSLQERLEAIEKHLD